MGSGSWDKSRSIIVLHLNHFHLNEVKRIQAIILSKFNIFSHKIKLFNQIRIKAIL